MHPVLFQIGSLVIPSYGPLVALGVLLALGLSQKTAKDASLDPRHAWNMLVLAVFASLAASRLLLIAINFGDLQRHPKWLLAVAMVHHPLLTAAGCVAGCVAISLYARWTDLRLAAVADCVAAPLCLCLAAEQLGALLAGSDYGRETGSAWAITYTNPLAARWSGAPLGVPVYPVQAYAAAGALVLAVCLMAGSRFFKRAKRAGDVAGSGLIGMGSLLSLTEVLRDWEGRGVLLGGIVDIPQLVGLGLVVAGALVLVDWRASPRETPALSERPSDVSNA